MKSTELDAYEAAVAVYDAHWKLQDEILYDLCKRFPTHATRSEVNAKVWIIGRTYQTGLERKVASSGSQGGALDVATEHMHRHHRAIDAAIRELRDLDEPLELDALATVLKVHARLDRIVSEVRLGGQSARSFVSKYLHFHCRIVPIFDSYAAKNAQRLVRWRGPIRNLIPPRDDVDEVYRRFTVRFFDLYRQLQQAGVTPKPTVRYLDRFLVEVGG